MDGKQLPRKDMEGRCHGTISVTFSSFHDCIQNLEVMIAGVPVDIRSYNRLALSVYQRARFNQRDLVTSLEAFLRVA